MGALYRLDHRILFLAARFVDAIVLIETADGTICGDDVNIEAIDVVELVRLGFGRDNNSRQFLVKPEVVLDGNCGQGLSLAINLDAFLGFNGLVKTIAPAAA